MRRWIVRLAIALVLLPALAVAGGVVFIQIPMGQRLLATQLEAALSSEGAPADVEGLSGSLPLSLRLDRLVLRDAEGAWLSLDEVAFAWSPLQLFRGRVQIDQLRVARLELARPPRGGPEPEPEPEPSGEPFALPEFPSFLPEIVVDDVGIDNLVLGEPVLGQAATFAFEASLLTLDGGEAVALDVDLRRTDEETARITLASRLKLDAGTFDIQLNGSETGGLLADVTALPDAGDAEVSLLGTGPLDGWTGRLVVGAEQLVDIDATLGFALGDAQRFDFGARILPGTAVLTPDLAAVMGERIDLALQARREEDGLLTIERFNLASDPALLTLDGTVDPEGGSLDLALDLEAPDFAILSSLAGTPLQGSLKAALAARGRLDQPEGSLRLTAEDLRAAGAGAETIESRLDWAFLRPLGAGEPEISARLRGTADGLALPVDQEVPLGTLTWRATAEVSERLTLRDVAIEANQIALTAAADLDRQTLGGDLEARVTIDDAGPYAAAFGQPTKGSVDLSLTAGVAPALETIDIALDGTLDQLSGLPAGANDFLGTTVTLTTAATVRPDDAAEVSDLRIDAANLEVRGQARVGLADPVVRGDLTIELPDLAALEPAAGVPLAGPLSIHLTADGEMASPEATVAVSSPRLVVADRVIESLSLDAAASELATAPDGRIDLTAVIEGLDVALGTAFGLDGQHLRISDLSLSAPATSLSGAVDLDLETTLAKGAIEGQVRDFSALAPLLPMPLAGRLNLAANIDTADGAQNARFDADLGALEGDFGRLGSATLTATGRDLTGEGAFDARFRANWFSQGDISVESIRLDARGTPAEIDLALAADGRAVQGFGVEAGAKVGLGEVIQIGLQSLTGDFAGRPLRLEEPATVRLAGPDVTVDGFDLSFATARITADGGIAGGTADLEVALRDLPLGLGATFGGPPLTGTAEANIALKGATSAPALAVDFGLQQVGIDGDYEDVPPLEAEGSVRLEGGRLEAGLEATGPTDGPAEVEIALPVTFAIEPFAFAVADDAPLDGRLKLALLLQQLVPFLPLDDQQLEGRLVADLTLGGNLKLPAPEGEVTLAGGAYANGETGTRIEELTLRAVADGRQIRLAELSATDGGKGRISGEGEVDLDAEAGFPFAGGIVLDQAELLRRLDAEATLGGRIDAEGDASGASVVGRLKVIRAEIAIPDGGGPSVAVIDVEEVGGGRGRPGNIEPEAGPESADDVEPYALDLDIQIDMPGRIYVRGKGLDSEWEGELTIEGSAEAPKIIGDIRVKRGSLDFIDRRFDLRKGVIDFAGSWPPSPLLDVEAASETDRLVAIVAITGPADDPEFELRSEPEMPQDEVLAQLLFGRQVSEIGPGEAATLAIAAAELAGGGGGGFDPLKKIRDTIGIDTLEVGGNADEQSVRAGKYLSEDVYVEVEQGTAEASGKAEVEIEVIPNVAVQADVTEEGRSGFGVEWRYDF